jgi:hypothetical protein
MLKILFNNPASTVSFPDRHPLFVGGPSLVSPGIHIGFHPFLMDAHLRYYLLYHGYKTFDIRCRVPTK